MQDGRRLDKRAQNGYAFLKGMNKKQENGPEAAVVADPLLKSFEAAGEEYADSLKLSLETKTILETPMISKEEYLKGVNGK